MKLWKKVTAVLVVLLLVLGTMSIGVCATGETGSIGISIRADKTTNLYPGDIVTFTVNISTSFRSIGMRWPVMYTLKAFEPVTANDGYGDADYGNVTGYGALADPDSYLESGEANTNEPFGTPYTKANYGCLLIQWTGAVTGNSVINYYEPNGADCLTFQLRVKPGYTSNKGVATVAIPTTSQAMGMFYLEGITTPSDGNSTFYLTPQTCTVTSTPTTVTIIKEAAGLLPKADTVIDTDGEINYIYGLNGLVANGETIDEDTLSDYVTLTGNATCELITNSFDMISTGAKLRLYDANGAFLSEYTFVVFGDINGDGVAELTDVDMLIDGYLGMQEWAWNPEDTKCNAMFFSCDINGDGRVESDDLGPLVEAMATFGYINQTHDPNDFFIYYN